MASKPSLISLIAAVPIVLVSSIPNLNHTVEPHLINFRSPNLFPEGLAYDPSAQHFIVGSFGHRIIVSVSEAGVIDTLIFDPTLLRYWSRAPNSTPSQPTTYAPANASSLLPSYQTTISDQVPSRTTSRLTSRGNAYVTNSGGNYIWKSVDYNLSYTDLGLNGVAYNSKGYLLVVQSNTDKMFKVDANDGTANLVLLSNDLLLAYRITIQNDNVVLVWRSTGRTKCTCCDGHLMEGVKGDVDYNLSYTDLGLNGVAYNSKGYLLVVQSNTDKMFKVDADDGTANLVLLSNDLLLAYRITIQNDNVVLVVSYKTLWLLMS
ncbi:hypothetical protein C1H46_043828 [Malus baccata]|uniref:Bulb-type lectin domain-containing protein n=1 Tax=Malus baccata TaxID=106549 RepID=A0A540K8S2_MALBA|nr:hypothetical protein C1H46_043828 [Malus baccata]